MPYKAENIKVTVNGVELNPCTAQDFYKTITEINMDHKKDYSLLRPFNLEAAKRGEKICNNRDTKSYTYLSGPTNIGEYAFEMIDGRIFVAENTTGDWKMAPLAWVEGKPVYRGDVLWHTGRKCTVIVDHADEFGHIHEEDDYGGDFIINLTWQKPKTKREGWVNVYPNRGQAHFHKSKEAADACATTADCCIDPDRAACVRIECEE